MFAIRVNFNITAWLTSFLISIYVVNDEYLYSRLLLNETCWWQKMWQLSFGDNSLLSFIFAINAYYTFSKSIYSFSYILNNVNFNLIYPNTSIHLACFDYVDLLTFKLIYKCGIHIHFVRRRIINRYTMADCHEQTIRDPLFEKNGWPTILCSFV